MGFFIFRDERSARRAMLPAKRVVDEIPADPVVLALFNDIYRHRRERRAWRRLVRYLIEQPLADQEIID
jgi:hypothetical protein